MSTSWGSRPRSIAKKGSSFGAWREARKWERISLGADPRGTENIRCPSNWKSVIRCEEMAVVVENVCFVWVPLWLAIDVKSGAYTPGLDSEGPL